MSYVIFVFSYVPGDFAMCMFCAAIPTAAAVGANLNSRQKAARGKATAKGIQLPAEKPIAKMTMGVIVLLAVGSVVYHTLKLPY
jgi:hypothetical protein